MSKDQQLQRFYNEDSTPNDRRATWLELFFDLVFVVAISGLAHVLHDHLTWSGIIDFAALFIPIWWLWIDFSYYADQFDVDRGPYRIIMLGVMFGIVVLSITIPNALHGGAVQFAAVYTALRLVIIGLYVQAWRLVPQSRELTARYILSFSVAFILWFISIFVPEPTCFWLWAVAMLIEITNGPITYATIRSVPAQVSHMDERFGLFVIIVLGEAVLAVATGVADSNWQWTAALTALSGFIAAVSFWWMYFERADHSVIHTTLRGGKRALLRSYIYGYSHVLVFAGIVATGVGTQAAIEAAVSSESLPTEARAVLWGGASIFLLGLSAVQWATPRSLPSNVLAIRLLSACLCVALGLLSSSLAPFAAVGLLAIILVSLTSCESVLL
jgi:low temperature requirement protein LtrA